MIIIFTYLITCDSRNFHFNTSISSSLVISIDDIEYDTDI